MYNFSKHFVESIEEFKNKGASVDEIDKKDISNMVSKKEKISHILEQISSKITSEELQSVEADLNIFLNGINPEDDLIMKGIESSKREMSRHNDIITELRQECPHNYVVKTHGYSDGGYDGPLYDERWIDHTCKICGERWTTDRKKN